MFRSFLVTLIVMPVLASAADRVGDFSLLDQDGYHHGMSWYDDHEAIVFLVQSNDSESVAAAIPEFNNLKAKFDAAGVEFMMINPMADQIGRQYSRKLKSMELIFLC